MLESAVADALSSEIDRETPLLRRFRAGARSVGHLFRLSRQRRFGDIPGWIDRFCDILSEIAASPLPAVVIERTPEGYAYYALYPESYFEAATRFSQEVGPRKAVCIGLRSIGASLSAVVAAALEGEGCPVQSHTVRPRGHPFHRRMHLAPALEADLCRSEGAHYLVIDEGPRVERLLEHLRGATALRTRSGGGADRLLPELGARPFPFSIGGGAGGDIGSIRSLSIFAS